MAQEPDIDLGAVTEALNNKTDTDVQNTTNVGSAQIAHFAAPSSHYDELTLGASGTTYTVPADGYFYLLKMASGTYQYGNLANQSNGMTFSSYPHDVGYGATVIMPAAKGDIVSCSYSVGGATTAFRFIYAKGCEPQS